jgi:hypothetical protein
MVYADLDDKDQAMTWIERAYAERFGPLLADPRFKDLFHRVCLIL